MYRPQFRLRSLLLETTFLAVVLGAWVERATIPESARPLRLIVTCVMALGAAGAVGVLMGRMWACLAFAGLYVAAALIFLL